MVARCCFSVLDVGIFQAEKYCTTRSIIIIIHTRDNMFNMIRPNYLYSRTREKNPLCRNYKKYKTPINKYYSQIPKQPSFPAFQCLTHGINLIPLTRCFLQLFPTSLQNLRAHSGYIFLLIVILKAEFYIYRATLLGHQEILIT